MRRITVVIGHPLSGSLNHSLAGSYRAEAEARGAEVRVIDLAQAQFSLSPADINDTRVRQREDVSRFEPDINTMLTDLEWAEHLVFFYPVWWGTFPAVLKGFLDRVFLSGVAYKQGDHPRDWQKFWKGKTARLVMTMDAPTFFHRLFYRAPGDNALRWATLWYVGVKTVGVTPFAPVKTSTPERRAQWFEKVAGLAQRDTR